MRIVVTVAVMDAGVWTGGGVKHAGVSDGIRAEVRVWRCLW